MLSLFFSMSIESSFMKNAVFLNHCQQLKTIADFTLVSKFDIILQFQIKSSDFVQGFY